MDDPWGGYLARVADPGLSILYIGLWAHTPVYTVYGYMAMGLGPGPWIWTLGS